jgi:hypothetical protein
MREIPFTFFLLSTRDLITVGNIPFSTDGKGGIASLHPPGPNE